MDYFFIPYAGMRQGGSSNTSNQSWNATLWSSSTDGSTAARRFAINDNLLASSYAAQRSDGYSVRCFKDVGTPDLPAIGGFRPFTTTWALPANLTLGIPTNGAGYDFEIDRGDGLTGKYSGTP